MPDFGAQPVFSVYGGISYRQWLIGQALAGRQGINPRIQAQEAVETADAVLAILAEEAEIAARLRTAD